MASKRATTEWGVPGDSASFAVIAAIAEVEGVDPTALDPLLYDAVDADALDRLFRASDRGSTLLDGRLEFSVAEYDVTVFGWGSVAVRRRDDESARTTGEPTRE
ncbi:HalOD1 output domain-containing protein [Halegenticoccus tardaugens]|uniref:HalOD1 output domain-containing protein n=1 Tax=Halegenticoccus tardaugens TaxID=2071624 RepID=UPI00100BCCDA|nr:HalOD1 output domain-containing protein [Halegenticoccus tardaugens]